MKILKSITNALTKAEEKRGVASVATVRQDVVRRAIEREEFELIKCAYHLTDDYAWDAVNNFGHDKNVTKEYMMKEYSILTPSCWVDPKLHEINGIQCYEISISFHSNLSYDMYVPVDGKKSEPVKEEKEEEKEMEEQKEKLYKRYDLQDESDFEIETLDQMKLWLADFWENNPDDDMSEEERNNLTDEIWASDADELFERLAGIDYSFYVLDKDGNVIEDEYEELPISIEQNFIMGYGVEVRQIEEKTLRVTVRRGEAEEAQVYTMEMPKTFEEVNEIFEAQRTVIRAEVNAIIEENGGLSKIINSEEEEEKDEEGEFESLNFILDHEKLCFTGYEFEGKEIFIEETGSTQSLFRMDICKEKNVVTVYSAYSEDYDVMEEVTHLFDIEKLRADIESWIAEHEDVPNHCEEYMEMNFEEQSVYICNECNEMHEDKTITCEYCPSESIREVAKSDMDMQVV